MRGAEGTLEVYSVDAVSMAEEGGEAREFSPLYSVKARAEQNQSW